MPLRQAGGRHGRPGEDDAMLEAQALLVRPWPNRAAGPTAAARRRTISDAATGQPLGFACKQLAGVPLWLHWLAAPVLAVHEAGDEPLLFTVHRFWNLGALWEVRDADGRRVAVVRRGRIEDRLGRSLAVRERATDGTGAWLREPGGPPLATSVQAAGGVCLYFGEALAGEPLVKMALLAASLVGQE
jgi:hypothetical protein